MLEILAMLPEEGWALVREDDRTLLIRPPYTLTGRRVVDADEVARAIAVHGFSVPTSQCRFPGWSSLVAHLNAQVEQSRAQQGHALAADGLGERLLPHAPEPILERFLNRIERELIPNPASWDAANRLLLAMLPLPRLRQSTDLKQRTAGLLNRVMEAEAARNTVLAIPSAEIGQQATLRPAEDDNDMDQARFAGMSAMTLADIMTAQVTAVPADYSVHWALTLMRGQRISALVVLDADRPIGIFTERDAVRFASYHRDAEVVPVCEAMSSPPITARSDMGCRDAYQLVRTHGVHHLIVTDPAGRLAGIVNEADFINHFAAADLLAAKTVRVVMTHGAVALPAEALMLNALPLMLDGRLDCVVVERHGRPVGILTERDMARLGEEGIDFATTALAKVMSHPVHTATPDEPVLIAIRRMKQAQTRRLVVVNEIGATMGIITRHDILKVLAQPGDFLGTVDALGTVANKDIATGFVPAPVDGVMASTASGVWLVTP